MPDIGFVNGQFAPLAEATVSVEDRGFQFGDGIYEVIRTYGGELFQAQAHLERLARSAQAIQLTLPYDLPKWMAYIKDGIDRAGYRESKVYLQVTRGVAPRDHQIPEGLVPTAVMTIREMSELDPRQREEGVGVVTLEDMRWGRCDIKSIDLLPNVLARRHARDAGAFETIFIRNGRVTEGAVANVMLVQSGGLVTPPEGPHILPGVTRRVVLELAQKDGISVEERPVTVRELRAADEVFLTGTTVEVLPVVRVDGERISTGRPGDLTGRLSARFRALVA